MSAATTGPNADKIDQLIRQVSELRATLRVCTAVMAVGFPVLVVLVGLLAARTTDNSVRLDRMSEGIDKLPAIEGEMRAQREYLFKIEGAMRKMAMKQ